VVGVLAMGGRAGFFVDGVLSEISGALRAAGHIHEAFYS
jgi:hypothetical protein